MLHKLPTRPSEPSKHAGLLSVPRASLNEDCLTSADRHVCAFNSEGGFAIGASSITLVRRQLEEGLAQGVSPITDK